MSSATSSRAGVCTSRAGSAARHRANRASSSTTGSSSSRHTWRNRSDVDSEGGSAIVAGRNPPSTQAQNAGKKSSSGNPCSTTGSPGRHPSPRNPDSTRRAVSSSSG